MKGRFVLAMLIAGGTALFAPDLATGEGGAAPAGGLALKGIMRNLGERMKEVTDAVWREDWTTVERVAPMIADHPQPPMAEKLRIMGFIGSDMGRFKGYDEEVHKAAVTLGKAARDKEGQAVINAFHSIQSACHGCHQDFRRPFLKNFYGKD